MLDYLTTAFEERLEIVNGYLRRHSDVPDKIIAQRLNSTQKFVESQRRFLGIPHYSECIIEPEPEWDPITTPDMLAAEEQENKMFDGRTRPDIWAKKDLIIKASNAGASERDIADVCNCSRSLIRTILGKKK